MKLDNKETAIIKSRLWFPALGLLIALSCAILSPSYLAVAALVINIVRWKSSRIREEVYLARPVFLFALCYALVAVCNLYLHVLQYFILSQDTFGNLVILSTSLFWLLTFIWSLFTVVPLQYSRTFSYSALAAAFLLGLWICLATPLRLAFWPTEPDKQPVEFVISPFSMRSLVVKGGSPWFLGHRYSWGLDLIPLKTPSSKDLPEGISSSNFLSKPEVANCFGAEIRLPISRAHIRGAFDGYVDDPNMKQEHDDGCGNFILLESEDDFGPYFLRFCHLMKGSLLVRKGDEVVGGAPLARCGNSGHSSAPHLHMEAYRTDENITVPLVTRHRSGPLATWWDALFGGLRSPQKLDLI